jgi:beta-galactosidase
MANPEGTGPPLPRRVLFGAAYYPEYMPYERLTVDLDLMKSAGFTVIRVGESVWSTWEPEESLFDLDWLDPVLTAAHERGIAAIVGTPSYAVPPWLRHNHPETTAHRRTGQPIPYGGRQDVDFSHPAFRQLVERLVRKIVARYADHPAVIGWQVDNEPGVELLHNPRVFAGFVDHLRARYGDVGTLNDRWGLTYWSHRISRWGELWPPDGNTDPPYALAWRRYQARLTADFVEWQVGIVRELARDDQFVTTCLAMDRPAVDNVLAMRRLDATAVNIYYPMQDALALPELAEPKVEARPAWLQSSGTWTLFWSADLARGVRQEPFLVTETDASTIGEHSVNFPAYDGQWRQVAWTLVARGARMIEYWNWHTIHQGNECHWGGILGHSLEPGRCYEEVARIGDEFERAGALIAGVEPDAPVALLVSPESRWALEFQPPLVVAGTSTPDPGSYGRIVTTFYRGLFETGLGVSVIQPDQLLADQGGLLARWPVLVVPALFVADDELLRRLAAYAEQGGHLVATFRTGIADDEGRIRAEVMPGALSAAVGAHYLESTNLASSVEVRAAGSAGASLNGGHATGWADALILDGAAALATYDHPHLGRWPAISTHRHGRGRVTYIGTLPDQVLARGLAGWIAATSLPGDPWRMAGGSITSAGALAPDGRRLHFLANWSWDPQSVMVPSAVIDVLSDDRIQPGTALVLGPWDTRIVVEMTGEHSSEQAVQAVPVTHPERPSRRDS